MKEHDRRRRSRPHKLAGALFPSEGLLPFGRSGPDDGGRGELAQLRCLPSIRQVHDEEVGKAWGEALSETSWGQQQPSARSVAHDAAEPQAELRGQGGAEHEDEEKDRVFAVAMAQALDAETRGAPCDLRQAQRSHLEQFFVEVENRVLCC